ncbi:MAG: hypothetical protein ACRDOI_15555, partial [Trebonia sp.]
MNDLSHGTETAELAAAPASETGDNPTHDEVGLDTGYDGDPGDLTADDQSPTRQDSRAATWGDDPGYGETDLDAEYDGDRGELTADDQLPTRQDSRAATWGDSPGYAGADPSDEYDGDLEALTTDDHAPDASEKRAPDSGNGDQDQAASDEAPPATEMPGDPPSEAPGISAAAVAEQESDNVAAPEPSPAGVPADGASSAEAGTRERPHEAAQPDDSRADPDTEAGLNELRAEYEANFKELRAEYEASFKELKAELAALKDSLQAPPDAPRNIGSAARQPRADVPPAERTNPKEVKQEGDRAGLGSNAKLAFYGAVASPVTLVLLEQFAPGVSHVVSDIVVGGPSIIGTLVPVLREGWKRKHDDSPGK